MRQSLYLSILLSVMMLLGTSCQQEDNTYDGPDFVMWSDTLSVLPVVDNDSVFNITISAAKAVDYDRNIAVELLMDKSNAIQGYHFDILNHTATIPAGKLTADVQVRGYSNNISVYDSLGFIMQIIPDEKSVSSLYGTQTKVMLQKACRFDIHDFEGYAVVQSSWIYNYMPTITERLIHVDIDPEHRNRVILRNFYYEGYDVHLDLTDNDILEPKLHFEEQVFAPTTEAFGTIYGNGKIMMSEPSNYISYYSSCERFLYIYTDLYVEKVGTVGTFVHAIKYVSDDEAERLISEGINH